MSDLMTFHDILPSMGGGKSVENTARYISDYNNLFNYWYANYGKLQSTYELNDFWQYAFDTVKDSTYINAFYNAPYTEYKLKNIDAQSYRAISNMIMISSTYGLGIDMINDIDLDITINNTSSSDIAGNIINIDNTQINVENVNVSVFTRNYGGENYNNANSVLSIKCPVKNCSLTYKTIGNRERLETLLTCESIENFKFKIDNIIKYNTNYDYLPLYNWIRVLGEDISNDINIEIDLADYRYLTYHIISTATTNAYIRPKTITKICDHLNIVFINPIKVGTSSSSSGTLYLTDYTTNENLYNYCNSFDLYYDFQNRTDCADLSQIPTGYKSGNLVSKSIHLKNLPSSLKSKYTADCFDIINVIE